MFPFARLTVIAVAWAVPAAWVSVALVAGPSDGTVVSTRTGEPDWGDDVTVVRVYGTTPLRAGDRVQGVDGRTVAEWVADGSAPERATGDVVTYEVRRPAASLDRILTLEVRLTDYPLRSAVAANLPVGLLVVGVLLTGSYLYWRRPDEAVARAWLVVGATAAAGASAYVFGTGVIDLAGGRGTWPQAGGELFLAASLGAVLLVAVTFPWPRPWLAGHRWRWALPFLVPAAGIAVWLAAVVAPAGSAIARAQAATMLALPAALATAPVVALALVQGYRRAPEREDRIALRLVLLALATAGVVLVLLGVFPARVIGRPLVPWDLLVLILTPPLLVTWVVAVLRLRLYEIDAALRRSLVQLLVATAVGAAFLAAVGAVDLASDASYESMVAGGAVALILLPAALAVRRALVAVVYGDRDLPLRVVSDLRALDVRTAPEDALREMLLVLGRRLRLSHASVEVHGASPDERLAASIGEPRGPATDVVLEAGGTVVGRLRLEADPARDPFGPRDRRLLEDVGSQMGVLVQAVLLSRELQRSREHMVTAREEERRRVRRDLHDGLGPSLATTAMNLEVAHDLIRDDPDGAAELVGQLAERTRADIGEVRRVVDGLRPPALDQLGLVSALRQQADEHNLAVRLGHGTMAWTVTAGDGVEPLPAAVEVAAYRIVVEAVTNAQRHSGATSCEVELSRDGGTLLVSVSDTGHGLVEHPVPGVGLASMRERADELGGTLSIESRPDRGTRVLARLPVTARPERGG